MSITVDVSQTRLAVVFRSPLCKASTITGCRDITDQPDVVGEAHQGAHRQRRPGLERTMANTTAVELSRASRDRSETLSRRARTSQARPLSRGSLAWRFLLPRTAKKRQTRLRTVNSRSARHRTQNLTAARSLEFAARGATRRAG
ncbi:hypothetical protein B0T18DRAFT_49218 [Schizothecium vesticola]|uniref:Uncharacterized protein n=1 Tax=Schizothecium vesticola TaxID=314040 RepID=A0AA40FBW8_9PEZI|nr:hypothetical protein B0T18DRAFT_49218 [Schizothecium vesticola]